MHIMLLSGDLVAQSHLAGASERLGASFVATGSVAAVLSACEARPPALVILDLGTAGLDPGDAVSRLRALSPPPRAIAAYGPHVHAAKLAAARAAGCDEVLSRGEFYARTDELLARYVRE